MCCHQINQERHEHLILQMPIRTHLSSDSRNPKCCRLCGFVKKANDELHIAAEAVYGRSDSSLPRKETMSTVQVL